MKQAMSVTARLTGSAVLTLVALQCHGVELSGQLNLEHRQFFSDGLQGQDNGQSSLVLQPELFWEIGEQSQFTFTPFYRLDSLDDERSHGDIREALYLTYWDDYELRAGIGKVFWGVTESAHLVDVVNQTDFTPTQKSLTAHVRHRATSLRSRRCLVGCTTAFGQARLATITLDGRTNTQRRRTSIY